MLVVQTEELETGPAAWLAERCELVRCSPEDEPRFSELLGRADGLVVRTYTRVDEALLANARQLKVVGRAGVALENVDIPACRARGVEVVHTPGANTRAVVEYATALILDAMRKRTPMTGPVVGEDWHRLRAEHFRNRQLSDLTLGVLGLGRIGSGMAFVGSAFEMRVIYNDIVEIPEERRHGAERVDLGVLKAESDILTIHIDYRPSNHHFVGADFLNGLKENVLLLNTSRGFVLDPSALTDCLRRRPEMRAMIDVHDPHEPIGSDYPLWGLPNATLFPHIAAGTVTAKTNMSWVVRDVWRVLSGEQPHHPAPTMA